MAKPLRIVHCFRSPVGGVFRHVRDLAEEQSKAGHEVGILCDSLTGGEHEDHLFDDIMPFLALGVVRLPIRRQISLSDASTLWSSYQKIKSLRPDVLHGHGAKGGLLARVLGSILRVNRYRIARLYTAHGGSLHFSRGSLQGLLVHSLERMLEFLTDGLIFICDFERLAYEKKIGKPRTRSVLIYNGISERDFRSIPTRSDSVHFVYIGMLRDLKGPDLFIEAFAVSQNIVVPSRLRYSLSRSSAITASRSWVFLISVRVWTVLRCSSSASMRATSRLKPRDARRSATS